MCSVRELQTVTQSVIQASVELSQYRYEQAKQCIKSANVLVAAEDYKGVREKRIPFLLLREIIVESKVLARSLYDDMAVIRKLNGI